MGKISKEDIEKKDKIRFERLKFADLEVLMSALETNTELKSLSLINCYRSFNPIAGKFGQILNKNTSLKVLNINGALLGDNLAFLLQALEANTSISELGLGYNDIHGWHAESVAALIRKNTTLSQLDLHCNELRSAGVRVIAGALRENKTLRGISFASSISGYEIGGDGALSLAEILVDNNTLEILDLTLNSIGDKGAKALAHALEKNCHLSSLLLSFNKIQSEGLRALAKSLINNTRLEKLTLGDNNFKLEDAIYLAECIKKNSSLIDFDVGYIRRIEVDASNERLRDQTAADIQSFLARNECAKIRAAIQENTLAALISFLQKYLEKLPHPEIVNELAYALFTLNVNDNCEKQAIYRLTLWLLRDNLHDDNHRSIIETCVQKLLNGGEEKIPPLASSDVYYLSYQALIREAKEIKSKEIAMPRLTLDYDAEKAKTLLAIPEIRKRLNLEPEQQVFLIDSLYANESSAIQLVIEADLKKLSELKLPDASSFKNVIQAELGFFGDKGDKKTYSINMYSGPT